MFRFEFSFLCKSNRRLSEQGRTFIEMLTVLSIMGIIVIAGLTGLSLAMRKIKVENNIKDMNLLQLIFFQSPLTLPERTLGKGLFFEG